MKQNRVTIDNAPGGKSITITSPKNTFTKIYLWISLIVLSLILTGIIAFLAISMAIGAATQPGITIVSAILILFSALDYIVYRQLVWQLKGKEIITIASNQLKITRTGWPGYRTQTFELSGIENMKIKQPKSSVLDYIYFSPGRISISSLIGTFRLIGNITFGYSGRLIQFGNELNNEESISIAQQIVGIGGLKEEQHD